jgi:phosphopantothenoylcysteine decarboxylase/phosphopantothenate--cysteine ligase
MQNLVGNGDPIFYIEIMNVLITAGPTVEPIDRVRRLTNFSTGRLGTRLANYLVERGHHVLLLRSRLSTCTEACLAQAIVPFETSAELARALESAGQGGRFDAVFHAAAVSDFRVGEVWAKAPDGSVTAAHGGKLSTREGSLLLELLPAPKLIAELKTWFPGTVLVGWKYEVDGTHTQVLDRALAQINECATHYCVANGPAYGDGFGLVSRNGECVHSPGPEELFRALEQALLTSSSEL